MRKLMLLSSLTLAGCATAPPPTVDLSGKDPARANIDMAECQDRVARGNVPIIYPDGSRGFHLSKCMEDKGYRVLTRSS